MSRPKHLRRISMPPAMCGFRPFGMTPHSDEKLVLTLDEYEAIRWLDYEGLTQEEAALKLGVSRSTLTRIYEKARKTIAQAFVEGKAIRMEGGDVCSDKTWLRCRKCHRLIEGHENHKRCEGCECYGEEELETVLNRHE